MGLAAKIASTFKIPKSEQTILSLFRQEKGVKILNDCWQNIMKNYQLLSCEIDDKEKFLAAFMTNNPKARLTNALSAYAFIEYIKEMGVNRFRNLIEKKYSRRTWYSLKASMNKYNFNTHIPSYFDADSQSLRYYKPLRLADYQDAF